MVRLDDSSRLATRWTVRVVPLLIVAILLLGVYAVVVRLCVQYLLLAKGWPALAAAFLTLYFILFILTMATYARTLYHVQFDSSGLVPLSGMAAMEKPPGDRRRPIATGEVEAISWPPPGPDPDCPGLESFFGKEVFVCDPDGRPKWCSYCRQWKPDRAHHSRELDCCVRKMDHFCPWVGGMVSETSFNFFFQFIFYATLLCSLCLAIAAFCLHHQNQEGRDVDGFVVAVIVLSTVFGFFTLAMALTSLRFIMTNITNIDALKKRQTLYIAVHIPLDSPPDERFSTIVYPLAWRAVDNGEYRQAHSRQVSCDLFSSRSLPDARKFAILRTEPGENPWDLGFWENWKSVMGNKVTEWIFPIKHSPCCNHDDTMSDYQLGPVVNDLRTRYGIFQSQEAVRRDLNKCNLAAPATTSLA